MSIKLSFNSQLIIVLVIIFTITLTENIQIADGLAASGDKMIFELQPGETKMLTWLVINDEEKLLDVEFYATDPGSELLIFEEYVTLEPNSKNRFEIFVSIPEDHENNVEFRPKLFVLTRGEKIEGAGAGIVMNLQMQTNPIIKIGDNPVYTLPIVEEKAETMKEKTPESIIPEEKTIVEKEQEETLEEKLAKIRAANTKNTNDELIIDPVSSSNPFVSEDDYIPEPTPYPEPVEIQKETVKTIEKIECGIWELFLSIFGLVKC